MALQLITVEVDIAQVAGGIPLGLVAEVLRAGHAVQATGGDRLGLHLVAELDDGDEAVAAGAVPLLGAGIGAGAERRQRTPARRTKHHRRARLGIVELLDDGAVVALEAIDVAPGRLPLAEVSRQLVRGRRQRLEAFLRRRLQLHVVVGIDVRLARGRAHPLPQVFTVEHGH